MSRFRAESIVRVIGECGQKIKLITTAVVSQTNAALGIAASTARTEKYLTAYITTPEGAENSMISVAGGSSRVGEYSCFVSAHDVAQGEFVPGSQIEYAGTVYNVNYNQAHLSQGRVVLHELIISPVR